jgi:uncharacterized YigZ family protein
MQVPTKSTTFKEEIKRSQFITYLEPVQSKVEAMDFLELLKIEYADARHHCWAYIIGEPSCTSEVGMSDDGEPHGTAGRPMLSTLQNRNVGDVIVVCVRYFGGTKLGTGGLVRAYTNGVLEVLDQCGLEEKIEKCQFKLAVPFSMESALRRFFSDSSVRVVDVCYVNKVNFDIEVPCSDLEDTQRALVDLTHGQVIFFHS